MGHILRDLEMSFLSWIGIKFRGELIWRECLGNSAPTSSVLCLVRKLVRVIKELLRRTLGNSVLSFEELETVICGCESVINSRPLTYISEESRELVPLTLSMFLIENRCSDDTDFEDPQPNKFAVNWVGPGVIDQKLSDTNYIVKKLDKKEKSQIYHINMLKPYYKRAERVNLLLTDKRDKEIEENDLEIDYPETHHTEINLEEIIQASELEGHVTEEDLKKLRKVLN
ncbi:hypothetical protein AVEN_30038-1 [Araneus ventricosus]|uniref:Integrase p58-like C-terminal domain-containing protein n=1 Tax=Araneus ventricosus TaxID=182803 RepID=A0A4Y2I7P6_ARAVE|nr:hypothetical protein AVEN_30038-1 [Araneus ventricosus]